MCYELIACLFKTDMSGGSFYPRGMFILPLPQGKMSHMTTIFQIANSQTKHGTISVNFVLQTDKPLNLIVDLYM